jgi:hypothetical protein
MSDTKQETVYQTFAREFNENIIQTTKGKIVNALKSPDITPCLIILIVITIILITFVFFIYELATKLKTVNINNIMDLFTSADLLSGTNSQDIDDFKKDCKYVFLVVFMLFFALLCIILMNNKRNRKTIMAGMVVTIGLLFVVMFYYNNTSSAYSKAYTSIMNKVFVIITFGIAIVTLALSYKLFANRLRNQPGMIGFILDLIFLIPCLFSDVVDYILKQFNMTSNTVFVLFIIEILLIIGYLTIPNAINARVTANSVPLLANSAFLMTPQTLTTEMLPTITITDPNTNATSTTSNTKYSLSMWVYLNQQLHNSGTFTNNIFSYGSENYGVKPQISYSNSSNNQTLKDIYQITFSGFSDPDRNIHGQSNSLLLELPGQKWNNFVFNYSGSEVHLYINGNLVRVFKFGPDHPNPQYDPSDIINIGDINGLDGAICNITYYNDPLSDSQIRMLYKMLSAHNPPVLSSVTSPSWTPSSLSV